MLHVTLILGDQMDLVSHCKLVVKKIHVGNVIVDF